MAEDEHDHTLVGGLAGRHRRPGLAALVGVGAAGHAHLAARGRATEAPDVHAGGLRPELRLALLIADAVPALTAAAAEGRVARRCPADAGATAQGVEPLAAHVLIQLADARVMAAAELISTSIGACLRLRNSTRPDPARSRVRGSRSEGRHNSGVGCNLGEIRPRLARSSVRQVSLAIRAVTCSRMANPPALGEGLLDVHTESRL